MADGDEQAIAFEIGSLAGFEVFEFDSSTPPALGRRRVFHRSVQTKEIFGFFSARSCMIFDARSLSRRWTTVTLLANLVRKVASSIAVSPPPTTRAFVFEEKAVAGRARRHAVAHEFHLGFEA